MESGGNGGAGIVQRAVVPPRELGALRYSCCVAGVPFSKECVPKGNSSGEGRVQPYTGRGAAPAGIVGAAGRDWHREEECPINANSCWEGISGGTTVSAGIQGVGGVLDNQNLPAYL
jgi:hypothetical protein